MSGVDEKTVNETVPRRVGPRAIFMMTTLIIAVVVTMIIPDFIRVLPLALANIAAFTLLARRLAPLGVSPAIYFAGYLSVIGLLGFTLTNVLTGSGGTGGVDVLLTMELRVQGANLLFYTSSIVLVVAAVFRGGTRRSKTEAGNSDGNLLDLGDLARFSGPILIIAVVEFALLIALLGVSDFFSRPDRLVGRDSSFEAAFQMVALGAVVALGIVVFSRAGAVRFLAIVLLGAYVAYFISLGTRRLALVPILILIGYILAKRGRIPVLGAIITALFALISLSLPLYFRGLPTHGLLPHLQGLYTFALNPEILAASANNVLAGFKITALTAFAQPSIGIEALWISLTPVSGDSAGWYDIARSLRLNRYTPYSSIGELANYGFGFLTVVASGIGLLLGVSQRLNGTLLRDPAWRLIGIAALGLTFVFVIQSTQYNLRSNLRYLYLMVAIQVVAYSLIRLRDWSRLRNGRI